MPQATLILHETLIRCARGMIAAWEAWLKQQKLNTKP